MRLFEILKNRSLTISVAESLTSGHVQAILGSQSGSSSYYKGGVTTYSLTSKSEILGIDPLLVKSSNGVSCEVVTEMAQKVSLLFDSDLGIATTGYAESFNEIAHPYAFIAAYSRYQDRTLFCTMLKFKELLTRSQVQEQVALKLIERLAFDLDQELSE